MRTFSISQLARQSETVGYALPGGSSARSFRIAKPLVLQGRKLGRVGVAKPEPSADDVLPVARPGRGAPRRRRDAEGSTPATEDISRLPVFTVGHSTRPISQFIELLTGFAIERLIDVRTVRRSRHNPQFDQDVLRLSVAPFGIVYEPAPDLGGLRRPSKVSKNLGWRNVSFRGYADHMESPEFERALNDLIAGSRVSSTVIMCAEAVPWRCHRSLISDALVIRGTVVRHVMGPGSVIPHRLTPFAVPRNGRPTYPASGQGAPTP